MTANPEHVEETERVSEVAKLLAKRDVGAVPICDTSGHLEGMVTDRDIVVKVIAQGKDPSNITVGEIADQEEVVTIGADDDLEELVTTMKQHKVRRLPVIDGNKLVGMVSQADVARALPPDRVGDLVEAISS
jgi:CBS domain-containing protein